MRKGTNHFSRMNYHVQRGMNYIIKDHSLTVSEWEELKREFQNRCAYCDEEPSMGNRGIVPDHLIPASDDGEYVIGNIIPACQRCNDQMGNKQWESFLQKTAGSEYEIRRQRILNHIKKYEYVKSDPKSRLTATQLSEFDTILSEWEDLWSRARQFRDSLRQNEID